MSKGLDDFNIDGELNVSSCTSQASGSRQTMSVNMSCCNVLLHIFSEMKSTLGSELVFWIEERPFEFQQHFLFSAFVIVQSMMNTVKVGKPNIAIVGVCTVGV